MRLGIFRWIWRALFGVSTPDTPHYHPLPKYYLFNETGNILVCSSNNHADRNDPYLKQAFTDVSVFFAAMTKALATTAVVDHSDNESNTKPVSIYNYEAMKEIFTKSGMFIETNKEHGYLVSKNVGETLGKKFVQTVLGRSFNEKSLSFTRGMFSGMSAQEGNPQEGQKYAKGGHVFFICELLNGLPTTSVVLVTIEPMNGKLGKGAKQHQFEYGTQGIDVLKYGAFQEKEYGICMRKRTWRFRKRSYLFVPPSLIKNADSILSVSRTNEYADLVDKLSMHLKPDTEDKII